MRLFLGLSLALVAVAAAQPAAEKTPVVFADTSRTGRPFTKNPSVIKFGGRYLLYYSFPGAPAEKNQRFTLGIAESRDLKTWTKLGEVAPLDGHETNGISAPGAVVIRGQVHLFYQTYGNGPKDALCHAFSDDGVHFTRDPSNPIFRPTGNWNIGRAIDAEVILWGDRALLYYATRDPKYERQMLGVAAAPRDSDFSRSTWTDLSTRGPILAPELPWELTCIEAASICVHDGRLVMFYAGGYNNAPQQIGVAESTDGVNWRRLLTEPLLRNGPPGSWNASESGHPAVFIDDDGATHLFYQGNNTGGKTWSIARQRLAWRNGVPVLAQD